MFTFYRKLFCRTWFIFTFDLGSCEKKLKQTYNAGSFKAPENRFKSSLEYRWVMHCSHSSCNAYGSTFASRFSVTPWVIRGSGLFFHVLSSHRGRSTIIRGSISTNESFLNASYRKREKEKNTLLIGYRCRYIHRINVNVEWSEMKCIAITSTRGQLCQTISLAYGLTAASLWLRLSRQVRSPIILNSVSRQRPLMHIYIKPRNTFLSTKRRSSSNQIIVWDVYYQFVRFWSNIFMIYAFFSILFMKLYCYQLQCVANFLRIKPYIHAVPVDNTAEWSKCSGAGVTVVHS